MCECRATATALIRAYTDALLCASASERQVAIAVIHALRQVMGQHKPEPLACPLPQPQQEVEACLQ